MRYRFAALSACLAVMASAGVAMAQPANGTCSLALPAQWVFPGAGGTIIQSGADLAGWSLSGASCATTGGTVYYNFTPATAGPWRLSTCATTPTFDTVLSIHTGCPANTTNYATGAAATSCNDTGVGCAGDTSTFDTTALTPGTTYVIRMSRWNSTVVPAGGVRVDVSNLNIPTSCCNATTGACTVAASAGACPAGTTALASANGVCTPNPCPQPPANDLCTAAQVIPATALPVNASVTGDLSAAQPVTTITPAVCASSSRDVFYSFTPVDSGNYTITTCNTVTGALDTVVSVHTGCPGDGSTAIATLCNDDACSGGAGPSTISNAALTGGTTYTIRVARWLTGAGGPFRLDITTGAFGACCDLAAGTCQLQSQTACTSPGVFQGDASVCSPNPCLGTCCNPTSGACTLTGSTGCASPNVFTAGPGAVCFPNPCPQPPGPANDECTAATVVALGTPAAGIISGATGTDLTTCSGSDVDVWFVFTPAASGLFNVTATPSTGADDALALAAFDVCPPFVDSNQPGTACAAQPGPGTPTTITVTGTAGTPLFIRAGAFLGDAGAFSLTVTATVGGACCNNTTGACTLSTTGTAGCGTTASYQGDNTSCSPSPCPASGTCCNPTSGACTLTIQAACASPSTWTQDGVCTPNPCPQPPAPANDTCAAAQVVTLGSPAATGTTVSAVTDLDEVQSCIDGTVNGVWFAFTPASAGAYQFDTRGGPLDTVLTVVDGCGGVELGCDDDAPGIFAGASEVQVTLVASQSVRVLVTNFSEFTTPGTFPLNITTITLGACCNTTTGACTLSSTGTAGCAAGSTYQGDNTACTPVSPCPASGTCCNPTTGGCTVTVEAACASPNTWTSGAVCTPNPCPQPPPPANDECAGATALQLNVAVTGANTAATGDGFEGPAGACYLLSTTNFGKAVWFTFTAPANDVYGFTACGSSFDTVLSVFDGTCAAIGTELGCDDDSCDGITPVGSANASVIAPIALTQGQIYLVRLAAWTTGTPTGGTYTLTATGTPVVSNIVCCRGVTCAVIAAVDCTAPAGVGISQIAGTTCAGQSAIVAGCCYADFNKSGIKDVADIFAFLSAWFANSPFSDVGGDGTGTRDVSDIFQFLSAWFAGCT